MIQEIKNYISASAVPLFRCDESLPLKALFDKRGFYFSPEATEQYNIIRNYPHLYVAFTKTEEGFYYVGKSYQAGGRWKRSHAYHLGTLAHHLLNTIRYDDQNHSHWIKAWMDEGSLVLDPGPYSILLKNTVYISFIPFSVYSDVAHSDLPKDEIRKINSCVERELIYLYRQDGYTLLNVHNNRMIDCQKYSL